MLYLSWDGPTTNYLEGLFFPVFERLGRRGVSVHVLQFSWDLERFRERTAAEAARRSVGYEVYPVPRSPLHLATGTAVTIGGALAAWRARQLGATVLMPRSHIPGAIALAARALSPSLDLVWDSDGLMPDERADFGGWRHDGLTYRAFARLERRLVRTASRTMTRTRAAAELLAQRTDVGLERFVVAPNGKDERLFAPASATERALRKDELGVPPEAPLVVHVGSLGPQYRPGELLGFFARLQHHRPDARLLLLTGAVDEARRLIAAAAISTDRVIVRSVTPEEVARLLGACDAGLAFREPSLSQRAVSPIKVAEYLLCGLPVLTNHGVGDLDHQLGGDAPAWFLRDFSGEALDELARQFADELLPARAQLAGRCRELGLKWYTLDGAAAAYAASLGLPAH